MKKLIIFVKKYGFFCDYEDLNVTPRVVSMMTK